MIFDTHAHYTSARFADHCTALLDSLPAQGVVGVIDCAVDYASAQASMELARAYPWVHTAVGIHPQSLIEEDASTQTQFGGDWRAELAALEPLLQDRRVVAVGECGLDYHWPVPKQAQTELFIAQLELARKHNMPVLVHDREAHADTYALLKAYRPKGVLHCYSGSADDAKWITAQGMYLGVGGVITFANNRQLRESVAAVPLECLVLETDCPYLAPVPFRGKECNSGMIGYIAAAVADIKGIDAQQVLQITRDNAQTLFGLVDTRNVSLKHP